MNNLRNIRTAVATLKARNKITQSGELQIESWRGQLTMYDSNSADVMICPEGFTYAADYKKDDVLDKYALKTYSGTNFLYYMILAPGPACRKENVSSDGKKYDLSFEDQRTGTGGATGDLSFANPVITVTIMGVDAKITVKGGGGGYRWDLVDMSDNDKAYLDNILKAQGAMPGDSAMLYGAVGLGGKFSYGMNSIVNDIDEIEPKILALDYPEELARIAGTNETHDNWTTWLGANGRYSFARHRGRCNVAMIDGSVVPKWPAEINPSDPVLLKQYWKP